MLILSSFPLLGAKLRPFSLLLKSGSSETNESRLFIHEHVDIMIPNSVICSVSSFFKHVYSSFFMFDVAVIKKKTHADIDFLHFYSLYIYTGTL